MSRNRIIKPEFCTSKTLSRISLESNLFFALMWTHCDDFGTILNSNRQLLGNCFPLREEITEKHIEKWKKELIDEKLIVPVVFNGTNILIMRSWEEHQKVPNISKRNNINNDLEINEIKAKIQDLIRQKLDPNLTEIRPSLESNSPMTNENINENEKREEAKIETAPDPVALDYPSFFKTETKALFEDYWKNRVKKKFAMTPYARKLLLSTVSQLSNCNDDYAYKVIQKSLLSSWGDFFALKDSAGNVIEPPEKEQKPDKKTDKTKEPWEKFKTVKEVTEYFFTYVEKGYNIEKMIEFMEEKDGNLYINDEKNIKEVYNWGLKLINSGNYKIKEKEKLNDMRWGLEK